MTQEQVSKLLGRPLKPFEVANFDQYLEIAKESVEELLCISLDVDDTSGEPEATMQLFEAREGYSTVFTGIFTDVTEVKVDGVVSTDYHRAFWDKRNSPYYNSIILSTRRAKEVEITAFWGFDELPADLKQLWAKAFAVVSAKKPVGNVKSKKVEDFSISYGDLSDDDVFVRDNSRVIKKYKMCHLGYILSGDVCRTHGVRRCGHCI
jgi:hypothetical protein